MTDANTIARLLIPNTLLIRQTAMLEVAGREGKKSEMPVCGRACLGTDALSSDEGCTVFLKMSSYLTSGDLSHYHLSLAEGWELGIHEGRH